MRSWNNIGVTGVTIVKLLEANVKDTKKLVQYFSILHIFALVIKIRA